MPSSGMRCAAGKRVAAGGVAGAGGSTRTRRESGLTALKRVQEEEEELDEEKGESRPTIEQAFKEALQV